MQKDWYKSKTILGILVCMLAAVLDYAGVSHLAALLWIGGAGLTAVGFRDAMK